MAREQGDRRARCRPSARQLPCACRTHSQVFTLDISRNEQRVLHALAQGGAITALKSADGKIIAVELYTRDGWLLACDLRLFRKLRNKDAIASSAGRPYRITRRGLELVRSEFDNR
jgi:uncharacterized protein